jgi:mono/diheme cytochrome c family protein
MCHKKAKERNRYSPFLKDTTRLCSNNLLADDHAEVDALFRDLWPEFDRSGARGVFEKLDYLWARYFAAKCKMCHGAQSEKHFDPKKPDGDFVEAILKGRDAKPVKMPAYAVEGVTEEQAKALVEYMKSLLK